MPALRGNYVLLRAGTLRLLLPQHDVGPAHYLEAKPHAGRQPGVFEFDRGDRGVRIAALSQQMTLLPVFPEDRYIATALSGVGDGLLWAWDEMKMLFDAALQPVLLPAVLTAPHCPIDAYFDDGEAVNYLCRAQPLGAFALSSEPDR